MRTATSNKFWSGDVEATARDLKTKGVQFLMEPKRQEWSTSAIFRDIDGNRFVLSSE